MKIGGNRLRRRRMMYNDGEKVVCFDDDLSTSRIKECTILSFGIGTDWSFDNAMADKGCKVDSRQ